MKPSQADITSSSWSGFPRDLTSFPDVYGGASISNVYVNTDGSIDQPSYDSIKLCTNYREGYNEFYTNEVKNAYNNYDITEVYSAD